MTCSGPARLAAIAVAVVAGCADTTGAPPAVTELSPRPGEVDVTVHTTLTVEFSEPVNIRGVYDPVRLELDELKVGGVTSVDGSTVTFAPARSLDPGREYTAMVSKEIAGSGGGTVSDTSWSFTTVGSPAPTVDTALIMPHLRALAHDSMNGRGSGTEDELRAARYIRDRFRALGLEPAPGGWFQTFDIPEDNHAGLVGASSQNVLGVLPGSGSLAHEWVMVGAHYDHEGLKRVSADSVIIYNGADDNASGTALLLALAEVLTGYAADGGFGGEPHRSIMFQAYGAEELGLVGSEHYTAHPVVPLDSLAGMLNFDMIGRLRSGEVFISGFWTSEEWEPVLLRYRGGLTLIDKQDCQSCSDYAPFRRAHRPAVWFFTGFHDQYSGPDDDVELINAPGIVHIANLSAGAVVHLAVRSTLLPFATVLP